MESGIPVVAVSVAARYLPYNYMLFSWIGIPLFVLLVTGLYFAGFNKVNGKFRVVIQELGRMCYEFYLAQFFIRKAGACLLEVTGIDGNRPRIVLSAALCALFAAVLHYGVENINNLKESRYVNY